MDKFLKIIPKVNQQGHFKEYYRHIPIYLYLSTLKLIFVTSQHTSKNVCHMFKNPH